MNYVNFTSQCGLLNREKGKKLLKLQVGLLLINARSNIIHIYHKGFAIDKYMDKYLIVAYARTDLQIQFRYVVFVWILNS